MMNALRGAWWSPRLSSMTCRDGLECLLVLCLVALCLVALRRVVE